MLRFDKLNKVFKTRTYNPRALFSLSALTTNTVGEAGGTREGILIACEITVQFD